MLGSINSLGTTCGVKPSVKLRLCNGVVKGSRGEISYGIKAVLSAIRDEWDGPSDSHRWHRGEDRRRGRDRRYPEGPTTTSHHEAASGAGPDHVRRERINDRLWDQQILLPNGHLELLL